MSFETPIIENAPAPEQENAPEGLEKIKVEYAPAIDTKVVKNFQM